MLYVSLTFPLAFQCRLMMLPYIKIANPSYSTDRIKIKSLNCNTKELQTSLLFYA